MEREEVRTRILSEHAQLRELLDELVGHIERFQYGSHEIGAELRARGIAFFEVFASHISLEDATLVPALRELGQEGNHLAERLAHEHQEQRELIRYLLARLEHDDRPSLVVAQELRNFSEYVRQDMAHEEETILREDLLVG
jgi:hemerythrin-like domain-containing protein